MNIIVIINEQMMKNRSPCKTSQNVTNEDKLKIIIRIRPILNEEDPSMFVNL